MVTILDSTVRAWEGGEDWSEREKSQKQWVIAEGTLEVLLWVCSISNQLWPCLSHVSLGHYNA